MTLQLLQLLSFAVAFEQSLYLDSSMILALFSADSIGKSSREKLASLIKQGASVNSSAIALYELTGTGLPGNFQLEAALPGLKKICQEFWSLTVEDLQMAMIYCKSGASHSMAIHAVLAIKHRAAIVSLLRYDFPGLFQEEIT